MLRLHSAFSSWRDYLTPTNNTSTFAATGELTPEEFVAAGDYLVYKFPTWSWCGVSDPSKRVNYLPEDKQYLVLKHAPCHTRLDDGFVAWNPDEEGDEPDDTAGLTGAFESMKVATAENKAASTAPTEEDDSDDEIPDMDDDDDDDEAIVRSDKGNKKRRGDAKVPLRYYNLYLTYSSYFRVPRSYLSGYDGSTNLPLHPPEAMFDDISADYRDKTVTIESFPFSETSMPVQMASVHPCRHAETMKRIFDSMANRKERRDAKEAEASSCEGKKGDDAEEDKEWEQVSAAVAVEAGEDGGLRVDQYLVVFVKFLAGVMPGVEMDYTMGI